MTLLVSSRASSSNSLCDYFLPHFASEDEDWKKFAYLLDSCGLPEDIEKEEVKDEDDSGTEEELPSFVSNGLKKEVHPPLPIPSPSPSLPPITPLAPSRSPTSQSQEIPTGRTEIGGLRVSARLQQRFLCSKERKEKVVEKRKRRSVQHAFPLTRNRKDDRGQSCGRGSKLDPREISLGPASNNGGESPKKVEGRRRASDSENSTRREKRVKIEPPSDEETSACICGQAYDPRKVYLKCNKCHRSIHARCIGIKESRAKKMTSWICTHCTKEEDVYCVCQTPYDETKFYVGCDSCEGWYHPSCVGITKEEAESVAEYVCPPCKKKKEETHTDILDLPSLQRCDYAMLSTVLSSVGGERIAAPYLHPVDTSLYLDYPQVVSHPMDLGTMQKKVETLDYQNIDEFEADFALMINNARNYNAEGSEIWKNSIVLEALFSSKMEEVKRCMKARREKLRKQSECGTLDSCLDIDTDQLINVDVDPAIFESLL